MGSSPHALLLPYPAQGHVIPFMALAHCLVNHGFKVTFVNTEFSHARLVAALADMEQAASGRIELVSIPDGLELEDSGARSDHGKLMAGLQKAMPPCLEELIRRIGDAGDQITCMIAFQGMAWALEVAKKMGVRTAAFWPASGAVLATILSIPELIARGVIDENGFPMAEGVFQLGPGMLPRPTSPGTTLAIGQPNRCSSITSSTTPGRPPRPTSSSATTVVLSPRRRCSPSPRA
ncbi:unnamed protein product [Musa hybrid cultivar]